MFASVCAATARYRADRCSDVPGGPVLAHRGPGQRGEVLGDADPGQLDARPSRAAATTAAGPASTSTHPTLPHQHCGPSRSRQMCPISPVLPLDPRKHVAVGDDPGADARAHVERGEAAGRVDLPAPVLPDGRRRRVVLEQDGQPDGACSASASGKSVHARMTGGVSATPVACVIGPGETTPRPRIRSGSTPAWETRRAQLGGDPGDHGVRARRHPAPGRRHRLTTAPPRSAMT